MKVSIKKRYVVGAAMLTSITLGYGLLQELQIRILQEGISVLVVPTIFLVSTVYTIIYFLNLRLKNKDADEVSKEVADGDPQKLELVKEHLCNKSWEESYTLNFLSKRIKFTSTWAAQAIVEKKKAVSHQKKVTE